MLTDTPVLIMLIGLLIILFVSTAFCALIQLKNREFSYTLSMGAFIFIWLGSIVYYGITIQTVDAAVFRL